ncbi:MAG: cyclase family protein [Rhizobiales bacterium]|nr:cyclase family protein [Hyphomicrobiales bacterium]
MDGANSDGPGAGSGALARISPATVLEALRLPRSGRVYDLGLELNDRIPSNPAFTPLSLQFTHRPDESGKGSSFQFSADTFSGGLHIGTHMDAFVHVQAGNRVFGGAAIGEALGPKGWTQYGMETVRPMIGRGILLDIPGLKGVARLDDRYEITIDDLKAELARKKLMIRQGDFVLVRTGKIQDWGNPAAFQAAEPGVGRDAAIWLYDAGMAVLATDTTGTEPLPFADEAATTHRAMLVERGVHLLENLFLEDAARDGASEGLFVNLPLRITGATGSWIRPILVV